jgi:Carboxypeptidase regulatory-like domain
MRFVKHTESGTIGTVNSAGKQSSKMFVGRNLKDLIPSFRTLFLLCALLGVSAAASLAQTQAPGVQRAPRTGASSGGQQPDQGTLGNISGIVVDESGSIVVGAKIRLTRQNQSSGTETVSDDDGKFSFANVAPGPFQLAITAASLSAQTVSGTLQPGESYVAPQVVLPVATQVTEVTVSAGFAPVEVAEIQIQDQEKQRVFGIIPNFYVSYIPNAKPLTSKQKFELAWKSSIDPFTFVAVGALAGIEQAADEYPGYGQGLEGYGKRYGAAYGDLTIGTFLGSAVLPSVLKQDPRYFYKGTGSTRSRILYALSTPFICKGDNGNWQPNYSYVFGNIAAGGISSLYYPSSDRSTTRVVFETAFLRFGENALSAVFQEFVVRRLTPHVRKHDAQN